MDCRSAGHGNHNSRGALREKRGYERERLPGRVRHERRAIVGASISARNAFPWKEPIAKPTLGRSSGFRINLLAAPSRGWESYWSAVVSRSVRSRLQRPDRNGVAPFSLFFLAHNECSRTPKSTALIIIASSSLSINAPFCFLAKSRKMSRAPDQLPKLFQRPS